MADLHGAGRSVPGGRGAAPILRSPRRPRVAMSVGLVALLAAALVLVSVAEPADVHADHRPPLLRADFLAAVGPNGTKPQGFGDRNNSWPWSMQWFQGKLYVGTNRAFGCVSLWMVHKGWPRIFPYPADDPSQNCADYATPTDLPLAAEIWRWTPETDSWDMVFRSPEDLPNPDPKYPGDMVPRELGFRTAEVFTGPDGVEALYFGGVHTRPMWDWDASDQFPPPRFVRTTNGQTFTSVPQDPDTFLGSLPSNSFRGMTAYDNGSRKQLFVIHGTIVGSGFLMASADPARGNDAWDRVSPAPVEFYDLAVFNGWLYALVTGFQGQPSYTVVKTKAEGSPPYQFVEVVPRGGYLTPKPAQYALSMAVHDDRLYVGAVEPSEIIRINKDDTWELVAGTPRQAPDGSWLYPTSGLDEGLNNGFNDHIWRMASSDGQLHVGTYDSSIQYRSYNGVVQASKHLFGADLVRTGGGWYFTPVTQNGFGDPYAIGIRNFAAHPQHGLFVGLADDSYGLTIWRGVLGSSSPSVRGPTRLEVETVNGNNVLAWEPSPNAAKYHIIAAPIQTIKVPRAILKPPLPTPTPTGAASGAVGREPTIPVGGTSVRTSDGISVVPSSATIGSAGAFDWFFMDVKIPGPYREIVATTNTFVAHPSIGQASYVYLVFAEDAAGRWSESSNLALGPSLNPPMTFTRVKATLAEYAARGRMTPAAATAAGQALDRALAAINGGNYAVAMDELRALRQAVLAGGVAPAPWQQDLEVLIYKLAVRTTLARYGVIGAAVLA